MNGRSLYTPLADINVTPLVDVTLVLLIIFMVTAPMLAVGVKVNLPQASRAAQPQQDPVTITLARDGALYVNAEPVARELLVSVVRARLRERTDSPIRLRGDRDASYGDMIGVLDLLASQGLTRIAIMTNTQPVDAAPQRPHD